MERIKKLSNIFYSLNLYTGKTDFKPGHNIMCFFLVEHPCSEEFIKDQALQLLMTPCPSFDFYGSRSHLWEAGFCAVYHQIYLNSNAAEGIQINRWNLFDGFIDVLNQALSCRPLIPCDIYLVYDDEDIYQKAIHRLKRYENINRYHPDW